MGKEYIEKRDDGGYWIANKRISLDVIVTDFNRGDSPETIRRNFSSLTLEEVYGALTFYLANQPMVDEYLCESEALYEQRAKEVNEELKLSDPEFFRKFASVEAVTK